MAFFSPLPRLQLNLVKTVPRRRLNPQNNNRFREQPAFFVCFFIPPTLNPPPSPPPVFLSFCHRRSVHQRGMRSMLTLPAQRPPAFGLCRKAMCVCKLTPPYFQTRTHSHELLPGLALHASPVLHLADPTRLLTDPASLT